MSLQRALPALLSFLLLAAACGDPPAPPAGADAGENTDASVDPVDGGGDPSDGGGEPSDAGEKDAGTVGPDNCEGEGGDPGIDPAHDWAEVDSLHDQALRDALRERIDGHVSLSYNDARREIRDNIDNHEGTIECIYTGRTTAAATAFSDTGKINIEHTWPESEMGTAWATGVSDMHHLFPSDGDANLRRSNWPFAYTDCDARGDCRWSLGGSNLQDLPGSTDKIFEVRPARRGDVARAHFYFSVRYGLPIDASEEAVLRCWNWGDPPDAEERARTGRVEAVQQNRNPFVDRPDFVERIADF